MLKTKSRSRLGRDTYSGCPLHLLYNFSVFLFYLKFQISSGKRLLDTLSKVNSNLGMEDVADYLYNLVGIVISFMKVLDCSFCIYCLNIFLIF